MEHKRGDSFDYVTTIPDTFPDGHFADWTVAAQVRDMSKGTLIAQLDVSWLDPVATRQLRLLKIDTRAWPVVPLAFDVQFTRPSDNFVVSSVTETFTVIKDVTQ